MVELKDFAHRKNAAGIDFCVRNDSTHSDHTHTHANTPDTENADDEQEERPQRIAALQAVRHIENVPLLLQLVHGELKLVLRAAGEADLGALGLLAASAKSQQIVWRDKKEI